jgi:D-alanyl-D-alanine carboxypeptidase
MESNLLLRTGCINFVAIFLWIFSTTVFAKPQYATLVMEYPSRTVLYSENPTALNQPASLTKVMTLYLVFKALDNGSLTLLQPLHISAHAANRQPSKLGLRPKDSITVEEAVCGLVTKSANDAASVLAENLAPTEDEFAQQMTEQARKLGLNHTVFKNASGIAHNQQLTTAVDMAILGSAILHDFPQYYHYFSLKEFNFHHHIFKSHNHLLGKYPGCDGIKTGFTAASGFNLLSSATRKGHRLIAVVLGGNSIKSRDMRMMQLLDAGFSKLASSQSTTTPLPVNTGNNLPAPANISPAKTTENLPHPQAYLNSPNTTVEEEF